MQRFLFPLGILNIVCLLAFASYSLFFNQQKIVFVNSGEIINGYTGMINDRKAFQQKTVVWKANIDTLSTEIKNRIMDYEKVSPKLTANERKLTEELIRAKQKQLSEYQQALNTQAQQEDSKMTTEVITQVNSYLKKYGKDKGYNVIIAATEYGNLAYADDGLDVTKEVLEGLNKDYSGQ